MSDAIAIYLILGASFTCYKLLHLMLIGQLKKDVGVFAFLYDSFMLTLASPLALAHDVFIKHIERMTGTKWECGKRIWNI